MRDRGEKDERDEGALGPRAYTSPNNVPVPRSMQRIVLAQKAVVGPGASRVQLKAAAIPQLVIAVRFTSRMRVVHPETKRVVESGRGGTVAGIQDSHLTYDQDEGFESLVVNVEPLAARRIVGMPSRELASRRVEFCDLWGKRAARELLDRLAETRERRGMRACFPIVHAFIRSRLASTDDGRESALVATACRVIRAGEGQLPISEIVRRMGYSQRHLIECFRDQLGVTPSFFSRLVRLDAATKRIGSGASLARVAADLGFSDQAHMTREFARLNGVPPSRLLREGSSGEYDMPGRNWIFSPRAVLGPVQT